MAIAGRVAIVPKGEYSNAVTYDKLDLVMFNNDAYIAKKASTGIEPTNDEYWMLILNNVVAEDLENIINGTTTVGNALKLNGLTAEKFVLGQGKNFASGETILSWAISPNGIYKKFAVEANGFPSDAPIKAEGYYELSIDGSGNRRQVKFTPFRADVLGSYTRTIFGNSWHTEWTNDSDGGNADTVDGAHLSDIKGWAISQFLKLDGSVPMSGNLSLANGVAKLEQYGGHTNIIQYNKNTSGGADSNNSRMLSIFNSSEVSDVKDGLKFRNKVNGTTTDYTVLHTGNKPTGTYTGTGSSTSRTITVGGVGKVLNIRCGNSWTTLVTPQGAFAWNCSTGTTKTFLSTEVYFGGDNGEIRLAIAHEAVNSANASYTYELL